MKKNDNNQTIKCEVESCKYNDEEGTCELNEIEVGCDCDNDKCSCTGETICKSFEEDEDKLDNSENDETEDDDEELEEE